MLCAMADCLSANVPGSPGAPGRAGATVDLDLTLVEYCLSLTPAERLRQAEEFAEFILTARRLNGVPWSDTERS
jgi:hypothetical protein